MPNISLSLLRRFGIAVFLYYRDTDQHSAPHIHARHQGRWVVLRIPDGVVLDGGIQGRMQRRVQEWIEANGDALTERWKLAVEGHEITRID